MNREHIELAIETLLAARELAQDAAEQAARNFRWNRPEDVYPYSMKTYAQVFTELKAEPARYDAAITYFRGLLEPTP